MMLGALLWLPLYSPPPVLYPSVELLCVLLWKTKPDQARLEGTLPPSPRVSFRVQFLDGLQTVLL